MNANPALHRKIGVVVIAPHFWQVDLKCLVSCPVIMLHVRQ
jgi:hypothetical protein